jgi:hypothetical protein
MNVTQGVLLTSLKKGRCLTMNVTEEGGGNNEANEHGYLLKAS